MATAKDRAEFPRALIFDLDGTLVDSRQDLALAVNAARRELGRPPLPAATIIGYVGDGVEMLMRRVLAHGSVAPAAGVPAAELAAGLAAFRAYYGDHAVDHTRCYPGVEAMLDACGERPLFVATNKPRVFTLRILEILGLASRFTGVVAGDDVPARKPDPAHLAACVRGLELPAAQIAMVGDGVADVRAGKAFGARVVAVTYGYTSHAKLQAEGPDLLAETPQEVVRALKLG